MQLPYLHAHSRLALEAEGAGRQGEVHPPQLEQLLRGDLAAAVHRPSLAGSNFCPVSLLASPCCLPGLHDASSTSSTSVLNLHWEEGFATEGISSCMLSVRS